MRVVVAAGLEEHEVPGVGDGGGVDAERGDLDPVRWAFIVVGPRLEVGTDDDASTLDLDLGRQRQIGGRRRRRVAGG